MNFSFPSLSATSFSSAAKPFCDENSSIDNSPPEVQKMIVEIFNISHSYNKKDKKICSGDNINFENEMFEVESAIQKSLNKSLISLAREIDHGKNQISFSRSQMEEMWGILKSENRKKLFIKSYFDIILKKQKEINEVIQFLQNEFGDNRTVINRIKHASDLIASTKSQHNAILRCSSKIYELRKKTEFVREKVDAYLKVETRDRIPSHDGNEFSLVKQLEKDFKNQQNERRRNLEKRETDPTKFIQKAQTSQPFSYSFGTGNNNILGAPKKNLTSTTSANANHVETSSIFSTPTSSKNVVTPTLNKSGGSLLNSNQGFVTPVLTKTGGSSKIIPDP